MAPITYIADTHAFMEKYLLLLSAGDILPIPVLGNSMSPFLVHQRDQVYLKAADRPLRIGDICLYRRDSGAYILHRICQVKGDTFTMVGDAHTVLEPGIRRDQIFAVAVSARRKGRTEQSGTLWWEFFARVWPRIVPLRPTVLKIYSTLRKPFGR